MLCTELLFPFTADDVCYDYLLNYTQQLSFVQKQSFRYSLLSMFFIHYLLSDFYSFDRTVYDANRCN